MSSEDTGDPGNTQSASDELRATRWHGRWNTPPVQANGGAMTSTTGTSTTGSSSTATTAPASTTATSATATTNVDAAIASARTADGVAIPQPAGPGGQCPAVVVALGFWACPTLGETCSFSSSSGVHDCICQRTDGEGQAASWVCN